MRKSIITIPYWIAIVYALTLFFELEISLGENFGNEISERINVLLNAVQTTTEEGKIVDEYRQMLSLHVNDVDSILNRVENTCKSPCPPNAELCIYMCKTNKVNNFIF